jgi:hypothetical protein
MNDESYQVDLSRLQVVVKPDWAGEALGETLIPPPRGSVSIFDPGLIPLLERHYRSNPWVESVISIRKVYPNSLEIKLELRRPVVAVESADHYYLVDRHGVRLPGSYRLLPKLLCTVIPVKGVNTPPPRAGERWSGQDVQAAAKVAHALIRNRVERLVEIMHIDVSNVGGRCDPRASEVVIWAKPCVPIQWGRASGEHFGELSAEQKIRNLRYVLMARGGRGLKGLKSVMIQFARPYYVSYDDD